MRAPSGWTDIRRSPAAWILLALVVAAVAAPWLAPADPARQLDIRLLRNAPPSFAHPFGTDLYSRDLLSRALYGARTSLLVGGVATALALLLACTWAVAATVLPPLWRSAVMVVNDSLRALPRKLVLLALLLLVPHPTVLTLAVLLGATSWMGLTPVLQAELARAMAEPYVDAARATGVSPWRVGWRHVVPALRGPLASVGAIVLADLITLEAVLAFLGIGVRAPTASWGGMLQDALPYLESAWWTALVPVVLVATCVGAIASLTDDVRAR
jgi:ABC-type dipeptide/oligopeptide/nickel transport system permease subunit